ncbi:MAG: hypothetical protein P4L85_18470 [Paludisphaera borealis]|uniref:hypothetical protein n=1 Tax=Paludisphaera borealis TaxID=1387353 RepID=UPI00283FD586|nr:hypothetical protein [Paludisphaera borealis]MDR3621342.1 hypothetical protein [Paludisphaera borealis]
MRGTSRSYRKRWSLFQACFWAALAAGNLLYAPHHGGYSLDNRGFVVGLVLLFVSVAWFEAYRRYRRPEKEAPEWLAWSPDRPALSLRDIAHDSRVDGVSLDVRPSADATIDMEGHHPGNVAGGDEVEDVVGLNRAGRDDE